MHIFNLTVSSDDSYASLIKNLYKDYYRKCNYTVTACITINPGNPDKVLLLCVVGQWKGLIILYTWTNYRMELVVRWNPMVYIMFQPYSIINPTIIYGVPNYKTI